MLSDILKLHSFFYFLMLCLSSGCKQNKLDTLQCKLSTLEDFKNSSSYKDWIETSDSGYIFLTYLTREKAPEQGLIFDYKNKLLSYVLYNLPHKHPRWILNYNNLLLQPQGEGKPIYFVSTHFNSSIVTDSFEVYIHTATPPNCKTTVSIYANGLEDADIVEKEHFINNNSIICFKGNAKNKHKEYFVTSSLFDTCSNYLIRTDTSNFAIN